MQTISSIKEGDWVDETYLVASKQVMIAKNGVAYLSLKLADRTGEIDGKMWDNAESAAGLFEKDDFIHIKGVAALYQGSMQVKMKALEKVDDAHIDLGNFLETSPRNIDDMTRELEQVAEGIRNVHLRRLMNAFLADRAFLDALKRAPAAKTLHHNYIGGLLEHVLELIFLCRDVANRFPGVDGDLLTVGAFIHDIGKVRELSVRKSIEYSTEGRLLGHISLGYEILSEKLRGLGGFPEELALLLKHIILSHHGEYEFGSPKRPKILEAMIINYLDDLAAKINNFQTTLRKENVTPGDWSGYSKMHDRYLYRPAPYSDVADEEVRTEAGGRAAGKGKKAVPVNNGEATGKLPLDI